MGLYSDALLRMVTCGVVWCFAAGGDVMWEDVDTVVMHDVSNDV